MKKLNLFIMSFSQNIISSIIMLIILSFALISMQDVIGQYRYITYSRYIIENQYLQNSDYFMINPEIMMVPDPNEQLKQSNSIKEKISKFDGVEGVAVAQHSKAVYRSAAVNTEIYNESMQKAFSKELSEGVWFEKADKSDIPNVVIGGAVFNDIPIGSDISLEMFDKNGNKVQQKVHVIGKIGYPWYAVSYSTISNDVSTKDFLIQVNTIIFDDDKQTSEILSKYDSFQSLSFSYFVIYNKECTDEQKEAVRDYYNSVGTYETYDQILENTNDYIRDNLMKKIVTPIFLLIIATLTLISIATLNTYKKLKDHSIYYLCGCSRKKSFAYLFAEISIVAILATIINIIYVSVIMSQLSAGTMSYAGSIIDYKNIIYSMIYCIVTIVITVILPFIVYKKNTPLEVYRRNHND